jgi:hypothetical protein
VEVVGCGREVDVVGLAVVGGGLVTGGTGATDAGLAVVELAGRAAGDPRPELAHPASKPTTAAAISASLRFISGS